MQLKSFFQLLLIGAILRCILWYLWLSGESGLSNNLKVDGSTPTLIAHKIGGLTAGGVAGP